jgi:hypothetical protein
MKRTIVITEEMANMLREKLEMSQYKFEHGVRSFLADLLDDPVNAQPNNMFKQYGLDRKSLINELIGCGVLKRKQKPTEMEKSGRLVGVMNTSFSVPKRDFDKKLEKLYHKLFGEGSREKLLHEEGEGGVMGGATSAAQSGQFTTPLFGVNRRKTKYFDNNEEDLDEATATTNVGDYEYDAPAFADEETLKRGNGAMGSTSINFSK